MHPAVSAIIVTHNSAAVLSRCLDALSCQTVALAEVIVVDSGSDDCEYLLPYKELEWVRVIETSNVGFSQANNLGMKLVAVQTEFVLFLNPDTFLTPLFLETALLVSQKNPRSGIISGKLCGYDAEKGVATGRLDSTGVFRKWYGRWYDRGQGEVDKGQYDKGAVVPALCGALLFCRVSALLDLGETIFDPDIFLYKEDIELSLRMRKKGWQLSYHPELMAYHCRGWKNQRGNMPLKIRKMAAESEILLYKKHPSPYRLWAWLKYLLVRFSHF